MTMSDIYTDLTYAHYMHTCIQTYTYVCVSGIYMHVYIYVHIHSEELGPEDNT